MLIRVITQHRSLVCRFIRREPARPTPGSGSNRAPGQLATRWSSGKICWHQTPGKPHAAYQTPWRGFIATGWGIVCGSKRSSSSYESATIGRARLLAVPQRGTHPHPNKTSSRPKRRTVSSSVAQQRVPVFSPLLSLVLAVAVVCTCRRIFLFLPSHFCLSS